MPVATTGRVRKTCSDRCRQIKRRQNYRTWRDPVRYAKEWRAAERTLRRMEKLCGRLPDTPPVYVDIYTPRISDRERMLIRLSRGMEVPTCPVCFKPYFAELSPDGIHCTSACAAEAKRSTEAVKRGIQMYAGSYDPRVDVRIDLGLPLKACLQCEKPFPPYNKKKKFCCAACRARHWREEKRRGMRKCPACGEDFEPNPSAPQHTYCSHACKQVMGGRRFRLKHSTLPKRRRCRYCHKAFKPNKHHPSRHLYCNSGCKDAAKRRRDALRLTQPPPIHQIAE